jgi:glycosyltransferase involved in cell wall biosynthesis
MNASAPTLAPPERPGVLHVVTGGFSGATQVAVDLALAQMTGGRYAPVLVLRRKRGTDPARVEALRQRGLTVHVVPGWSHLATIVALARLCRTLRPQVLIAHGFPEHLLGRWAGWWAGVPRLVQVEHNSRERYTPWRRLQARWLDGRTARFVGVSEGVRRSLLRLGRPPERTVAIPNGIDLARFPPLPEDAPRDAALIMAARFARQKDHVTLVRALALLRTQGFTPTLRFAGGGGGRHRRRLASAVQHLGVSAQVEFLEHQPDLPRVLQAQAIFVLATHYEGMPLALVEAMAAGCACIASAVPGTEDVFVDGESGLLVPEGDAPALAAAIARLLADPGLARRLGQAARLHALQHHDRALMLARYEALLDAL